MRGCFVLCVQIYVAKIYDDPNLHFLKKIGPDTAAVQINFCTLIATGGTTRWRDLYTSRDGKTNGAKKLKRCTPTRDLRFILGRRIN